jgi:hypothetical protein
MKGIWPLATGVVGAAEDKHESNCHALISNALRLILAHAYREVAESNPVK